MPDLDEGWPQMATQYRVEGGKLETLNMQSKWRQALALGVTVYQ